MKNRKALSFLLALMILLSSLPIMGVTAFAATSGDYQYTVLSNGTAEITKYTGSATNLSIPSKIGSYSVTRIGNSAFSQNTKLTSVTIPSGVTSIGLHAFNSCTSLKSVSIPNTVTSIVQHAFFGCSSLTSVTIPSSVTSIGYYAFMSCHSLTSINVDSNNKNYSSQDGVLFDKAKTKLIQYPIGNTRTSYTIPSTVTNIGDRAFLKAIKLTSITIPSSVKSIDYYAFEGCTSLTNVTLPSSLTSIPKDLFSGCSRLKSVTLPNSITSIGEYAFNGCASLKDVYYTGSSTQWGKISIENHNDPLKNATIHYNYGAQLATPKISSLVNTSTGVKITWGKVTDAEKYRVFYKTGNGSWTKIADTTSTSYTWTGAKSGTKYSFTVRCVSSDGKSYTSSYDSTGKSITYISAPKISSISNTSTGVKITWGKVTGATKYRVFYKTGNGNWTKIADTTSTSHTWTGAKSSIKYTFTIRCISSDGNTYTSSYDSTGKSITFTAPSTSSLATPKISSVSNGAVGVKISWGKITGAVNYRLFYKTGNGNWTKIADTATTSYMWNGAKSGTKYTFTVRCIDKDGKNYTSSYDSTGKSITYIAAPLISSVANSSAGVKITWGKVTGAAKYRVFYKTGNGSWTKIADTTSTSYTWKNANNGTKYVFTIRCISNDGKTYTSSYYDSDYGKNSICVINNGSSLDAQVNKIIASGSYHISEARSMLQMVNQMRTGNNAWYWNSDNKTKTIKKVGTLTYDYALEQIAMRRAAELVLYYDHTRPDGSYFSDVKYNGVKACSENIATGYSTAESVFIGWSEENEKYSGQGHRRNMLNSEYTAIGIACFEYNGHMYWVQSFGKSNSGIKDPTSSSLATPKLSSVENTATGVKINWGKVSGAAKYRAFYKTGNGSWTKITDTTGTSYTWTGAKSGTKYTFTVRCISGDGKSYTSSYDSTGKSITFLSAPKISSLSKSSSGITIKWSKVTGATKYRVFYKTGNGSWTKIADTTSTSYTWTGGKSGMKYTFTIRCISSDGKSYTSGYDSTGKSIIK